VKFRRDLGMLEALGLSLSIIAPTMSMSFGTTLAVQAAGIAAPLSFLIGMLAMVIVGLSFVAFGRRIASSGSVYAYIGYTFGQRAGFVAGWALLLT
jgi:amino acid transporter